MALVNGRTDFDEQFFNKKTSISKGTDIFTLGGDFFSIKTNLEERKVRDLVNNLDNFSDPVTLDTLVVIKNVEIKVENFNTATLNLDKTVLTNHSYFGSLRDKFEHSIVNIVNTFPASLYINNEYNDVLFTIMNYSYDTISNRASMKIPVNAVTNTYGLKTKKTDNPLLSTTDELRNVSVSYSRYSLWNFNTEFPLMSYTGNTNTDNYLYVTVLGNPFESVTGSTALVNFHLKPNYDNYTLFLANLDEFQAYLLNRDNNPKYTATFKVPNEDNEGNTLLIDESFTWKTTDGYNLDYDTYEFQTYSEALINVAQSLDDYKTNLVSRYLTASAIKEFDTPDQRTDKLLRLYGKEFDDIKQYIDGLANLIKVSYDKKDNMPDILVKNFARTLGFGTFSTVNEKDLMKSFLGQDSSIVLSGTTSNLTPAEADVELWRRMIINSAFLFKSKGTRDCIDFLFRIIGAPKSLVEFNEYVYVAQNKIDVSVVENTPDLNFPFDDEGYPKPVADTPDYWFQMKGGWISNKEIAPTNSKNYLSVIGIHTGDYDGGSTYFKAFTDFEGTQGFDLNRVLDNVKSWKKSETGHSNIDRETRYEAHDSRFVLNSKEASIFMSPARAVETDVYEYNKAEGYVINPIGLPYPYPDNDLTRADVTKMSFIEYVDFIYSRFINAKNRKVIETFGNGYPTLKRLYEDYYNAQNDSIFTEEFNEPFEDTGESRKLTTNKVLKYIDQIGDFWISLLEQFIPSTTIWQGGIVYKNTVFDRQKFDYKQGINDGSEFQTGQLVNPDIVINAASAYGTVSLPYEAIIEDIVTANALYSSNLNFPDDGGSGIDDGQKPNILRVKPFWDSDQLSLIQPCVQATQVFEIVSGCTEPIIHNISLGNKEVDFLFNCNTQFFTEGGKFKYTVYPYDTITGTFLTGATYSKLFNVIIPSGGVANVHEVINYTFPDGDYLIKPGFKYELLLTGDTHANIKAHFKRLNEVGLISNTGFKLQGDTLLFESTNTNPTGYYGMYNYETDWWFSIISPPFKPVIQNVNFEPGNFSGATLVNEKLPITFVNQKIFIINDIPNGDIFLNLNGVTLLKSLTSDFSDNAEFYSEVAGLTLKVTLNPDLGVYLDDVLNVIYIRSSNSGSFESIFDHISNIPSGTTATNGILYNTSTNLYEYYLPFILNDDVNLQELIVTVNGLTLTIISDYYMSSSNPNKIIFSGVINVGDEILMYYPQASQGSNFIPSKTFIAMWKVQNDYHTGVYTVEVSEDSSFSNIIMTGSTPYIPVTPTAMMDYSLIVGDFTIPNKKYFFRIKSVKNNVNLLGEITKTIIYSTTMFFLTDNRVLI